MPKTATPIEHEARAERLREFLEDCAKWRGDSLEEAGVNEEAGAACVPRRYAIQTWDGSESYIDFYDSVPEAREGAAGSVEGEAPWAPGKLIDLDTGNTWEPSVTVTLTPLRWGLRVRTTYNWSEREPNVTEAMMRFATEEAAAKYAAYIAESSGAIGRETLEGPIELFTQAEADEQAGDAAADDRTVRRIVADLRDEANAFERAQREAQREGGGMPSSPVSARGARAIADRIEAKWGAIADG